MPQGPRLNLTQLSTLRELVRRGTLAATAEHAEELLAAEARAAGLVATVMTGLMP